MPDFGLDRRRFVQAAGATGLAAALPTTAGATPAQAALADDLDLDGDAQEVLVVFDSNDHVAQLENVALPEGYHRFEVLPIGYTIATGDQLREIAARPSVVHVQPNRELEYHNADARAETGVSQVQNGGDGFTGENAHVAVIDSGLSGLHPDHRGDVQHNYKYQNPLQRDTAWVDAKPGDTDDNGHGTHVSGTVAGNGTFSENGAVEDQNQRGMAPDARLTVYSTGVTLAVLNTIAAFDHLLANHTSETAASEAEVVHLTNNSYGLTSGNNVDFDPNSAMSRATYACYRSGILSFFSAGNSGPATNTYSNYAKAPWVVGVAATNDERALANFSSRGRNPDNFDQAYKTNSDRQLALSNVEELYASQDADPAAEAQVGSESFSGGPIAGGAVVGLNQSSGTFPIPSGDPSFTPDRYEVRATLTWTPANPQGPEPNDVDFDLLDASGNVVASSGTGGSETQSDPTESLTGTVEQGSTYSFQVTGWRGVANWSIEAEIFAVQDGEYSPSRPYGVYNPDLGATGVSIVSTMSPNDPLQPTDNGDNQSLASPYYAAISGTSMSSPTATGATALVIDAYVAEYGEYPDPETLFQLLEGVGTTFSSDKGHKVLNIGNGFIDVSFATDIASVTDDPNAPADGGDGEDGDGSEDDGDNDENGQGDENQDENADEKEDNGGDGGDNGEGGNGGSSGVMSEFHSNGF